MRKFRSFILWSGGKESYLSYLKALRRGFDVEFALSYVDRRTKRLTGCFLREDVVRRQAEALKLKFVPVYGSKREGSLLPSLRKILSTLDVEAGVFGIISQEEHRNALEMVCSSAGIRAIFPLWKASEEYVIEEVLKICSPVILCRRVRVVPRRFLGKVLDEGFLSFLRSRELSLCGENGEYQTLVIKGPEFKLDVKVLRNFRRYYYECIDVSTGGKD